MLESAGWYGKFQGIEMHTQVSAEALSEAGWPGKNTGTYIGCMFVDYMNLQREGYGLASTGAVGSCCYNISKTLK